MTPSSDRPEDADKTDAAPSQENTSQDGATTDESAPASNPDEADSKPVESASDVIDVAAEPVEPEPNPAEPAAHQMAPQVPEDASDKASRGTGPIGLIASVVIAAIIGGAVVLLGAPFFGGSGGGGQDVSDLSAEVSDLRDRLNRANLETLKQRLSALEAGVSVLNGVAQTEPGAGEPDPSGLANVRAQLQSTVDLIGRLSGRIEQLETSATTEAVASGFGGGDAGAAAEAVAQIQSDIIGIRSRLDAITNALDSRAAGLGDRIGALETTVPSDLSVVLSRTAKKSDLAALIERLDAIERNTAALDAKRAAAAVALANLSRAAMTGQSFDQELSAVDLLGGQASGLGALTQYAATGVRPVADLLGEFDQVARDAIRAENTSAGNWWSRLWANLRNLFLVRRRDQIEGPSVMAVVNRAELAADAGNLNGAADELQNLTGAAGEAVSTWLLEAQARLELDQLITDLSTQLLEDLDNQ